jgi:hypothetical protein
MKMVQGLQSLHIIRRMSSATDTPQQVDMHAREHIHATATARKQRLLVLP